MKVKHLIAALQKCDPEAEILSQWEGCDEPINAVIKSGKTIKINCDQHMYDTNEGEEILLVDPENEWLQWRLGGDSDA